MSTDSRDRRLITEYGTGYKGDGVMRTATAPFATSERPQPGDRVTLLPDHFSDAEPLEIEVREYQEIMRDGSVEVLVTTVDDERGWVEKRWMRDNPEATNA